MARHRAAYAPVEGGQPELAFGGEYHLRRDGEFHAWNERTVARLQHAVRNDDPGAYAQFSDLVNDQSRSLCTLRGLLELADTESVPLEEVEPASEIVKRFSTGAMSYGSISKEAHEALAVAMNAKLSLSLGFEVRHNSDVPQGVAENTDTVTTANLVYNF